MVSFRTGVPLLPKGGAIEEEQPYSLEDNLVLKSEEERISILRAIKSNFLFEHTTDDQKQVKNNLAWIALPSCWRLARWVPSV